MSQLKIELKSLVHKLDLSDIEFNCLISGIVTAWKRTPELNRRLNVMDDVSTEELEIGLLHLAIWWTLKEENSSDVELQCINTSELMVRLVFDLLAESSREEVFSSLVREFSGVGADRVMLHLVGIVTGLVTVTTLNDFLLPPEGHKPSGRRFNRVFLKRVDDPVFLRAVRE
jgi:hypothetical protein